MAAAEDDVIVRIDRLRATVDTFKTPIGRIKDYNDEDVLPPPIRAVTWTRSRSSSLDRPDDGSNKQPAVDSSGEKKEQDGDDADEMWRYSPDRVSSKPKVTLAQLRQQIKQTKCVEFAPFSDCCADDDDSSTLPFGVRPQRYLGNILRLAKRPLFKDLVLGQLSCMLLCDTFWWLWLEAFAPTHVDPLHHQQRRLFDRLSEVYVQLLFGLPTSLKDRFLNHYPDWLAQTVYSVFATSFSDSREQFDNKFKMEVASLLSDWIRGNAALPGSWKSWPCKHLILDITEETGAGQELPWNPSRPTLSQAVELELQEWLKEDVETKELQCPVKCPGQSERARLPFNTKGFSPLVAHYRANHGIVQETSPAVMKQLTFVDPARTGLRQ
eukprot:m.487081 g.487081  ORF g.487081 m.487081 type:complete len:382 (+) comp24776_c0_seq1:91-1236(+)